MPRIVWLITCGFALLLLAYSVLVPAFRGPDEPHHLDLALHVQATGEYPRFDDRLIGVSVMKALSVVRFGDMSRDLGADEAPPRSARPPLEDLSPLEPHVNQIPQHPPLYYYAIAGASGALDAVTPGGARERSFDLTVAILRLLNILMLVPLPLIAFLIARELQAPPEGAVAAAILPLGVPQLTHIGSVINNDNLLILLVSVLTLLLVVVARGALSVRMSVAIGVIAGAALLTKGFAIFLPAWIVLAYAIAAKREGEWKLAGGRAALASGIGLLIGGWWWARNVIRDGSLQPGVELLQPAPDGFSPDPAWWLQMFARSMVERFWGWFGWFDVRIPVWAIALGAAALAIGVVYVLVARTRPGVKSRFILALTPILVLTALAAVFAYGEYVRTGLPAAVQGRYLFPGLVGAAAVAATGWAYILDRNRRLLPAAAFLLVAVLQAAGIATIVRFYWHSEGRGLLGLLNSIAAWSPWPTALLLALAASGLILTTAIVRELTIPLRQANRD